MQGAFPKWQKLHYIQYIIQRFGERIRYNDTLFDALLKNGPVF